MIDYSWMSNVMLGQLSAETKRNRQKHEWKGPKKGPKVPCIRF